MTQFVWPVATTIGIIQRFGENPDRYPKTGGHMGLDFDCPEGTPVKCIADGKITRVSVDPNGWGRYVMIDHGDGLVSIYAHLSAPVVSAGQKIHSGDSVGVSGATGWTWRYDNNNTPYPHLHLEMRKNNKPIDPLSLLILPQAEEQPEVTPVVFTAPPAPWNGRVITDRLNIRTGPSRLSPDVGDLQRTYQVDVIGEPVNNMGVTWVPVRLWVALGEDDGSVYLEAANA